jgi:acyl carrier protein
MNIKQIEEKIIKCIKNNMKESGDEVPEINQSTGILTGISGFDSLRAIEVLIDLEDIFNCELPPEKVFIKIPAGTDNINDLAKAVQKIVDKEKL